MSEVTDPLRGESEPSRLWATANSMEAVPDVMSPLCLSVWGGPCEMAYRRSFHDQGILAKRDMRPPSDNNEMYAGCFYGRYVTNVDLMRGLFGAIPGVSADDFERDFTGSVRPDAEQPKKDWKRVPIIAVKSRWARSVHAKRAEALDREQTAWWTEQVLDGKGLEAPVAFLRDAAQRVENSMHIHQLSRSLSQPVQAQITQFATRAGNAELAISIYGGFGGVREAGMAEDLWRVRHGSISLGEFTRRHGYHGPNEGNLYAHSWREDPSQLAEIVSTLGHRSDAEDPRLRTTEIRHAQETAVNTVSRSLSSREVNKLRRAVAAAVELVRCIEVTKTNLVMSLDGVRAAAREIGRRQVDAGALDDLDDIFFLTYEEIADGLPSDARSRAKFRKERWEEYRGLRLPDTFIGMPEPVERDLEQVRDGDLLTGVAGSPGVVEGPARIVADPSSAVLEPGDILVCELTDPSWTPLFLLAAGLVIDIGGPASHGAIVARELGIPCVIATKNGSLVLRDADRLRVDGTNGTVTVLTDEAGGDGE